MDTQGVKGQTLRAEKKLESETEAEDGRYCKVKQDKTR